MGITIEKHPKKKHAAIMTLTCDNPHGLLAPPKQTFISRPDMFLPAMGYQAGWGTTSRNGERQFLCPKCVGRKTPFVCSD